MFSTVMCGGMEWRHVQYCEEGSMLVKYCIVGNFHGCIYINFCKVTIQFVNIFAV